MSKASYDGFVFLHRKLLDNPLMNQLPSAWFRIFIAILLKVNWKPGKWHNAGKDIDIPAGSVITSVEKLGASTYSSRTQVRGCLRYLQAASIATITGAKHHTLITLLNWQTYQPLAGVDDQLDDQHDDQLATNSRPTRDQLATTIEESNKETKKETTPSPDGSETPAEAELRGRINKTAESIKARHPGKRNASVALIVGKLTTIAKRFKAEERIATLDRVDRNHQAWCKSLDWTKEDSQYAKGIIPWLNPASELYLNEPVSRPAAAGPHPGMVL